MRAAASFGSAERIFKASSFACDKQVQFGRDIGQLELRQSMLSRAEELARAAQFQIHLGDGETVVGLGHRAAAVPARSRSCREKSGCNTKPPTRDRRGREAGAVATGQIARRCRSASPSHWVRRCRLRSPSSRSAHRVSPARKCDHRRLLFVGRHLAVQHRQAQALQWAFGQAIELDANRFGFLKTVVIDLRDDDDTPVDPRRPACG